jgi:putative endonuclease
VSRGASGRPEDDGGGERAESPPGAVDQVARWYEDQDYEVLERTWRRREGEVDLIVRRGVTVVFSEVTRPNDGSTSEGEPLLAATQRRMRRLADRWLSEITPAVGRARIEVRFDVASVTAGTIEVIEDAF